MHTTVEIVEKKMITKEFVTSNTMIYREDSFVIQKLYDMLDLFIRVNGQLGGKQSGDMRKVTRLMTEIVQHMITIPILSKNTGQTWSTMHAHFI